jgi:hypothetical protein
VALIVSKEALIVSKEALIVAKVALIVSKEAPVLCPKAWDKPQEIVGVGCLLCCRPIICHACLLTLLYFAYIIYMLD